MKVCTRCRWEKNRRCYSVKNGIDIVDGSVYTELCLHNRREKLSFEKDPRCGPEAEWFEQRRGIRLTYNQGVVIMVVMIVCLVAIGILS